MSDPEVVGFKSIAAYRSGLDVQPFDSEKLTSSWNLAYGEVRDYPPGRFRVKQRGIVTWLVNATCSAISGKGKPREFTNQFILSWTNTGPIQYSSILGKYGYTDISLRAETPNTGSEIMILT